MNKASLNKKPNDSNFLFGNEGYKSLNEFIINKNYSKVFVLVDNNTNKNCFSHFQNQIFVKKVRNSIIRIIFKKN